LKLKNRNIKTYSIQGIFLTSNDNKGMFNEILNKKADYMLIGRNEGEYLFNEDPLFKKSLEMINLNNLPEGEKRYFMCSKRMEKDLISSIDKEISKLKK